MDGLTPAQQQRRAQQTEIRQRFRADSLEEIAPIAARQPVPRRLHHYTTLDGLMGIVDSNSIWASDARFVNDASELTYASEVIDSEILAVLGEAGAIRQYLNPHNEMANPFQIGPQPFIACFCEEGDLLSQWRGYAANDSGYSLGFDLTGPLSFDLASKVVLRKVIYDPEEQRAEVQSIVRRWIKTAEELLDEDRFAPEEIFPYPAIWALTEALAEHHLCFKNPTFAEEREWRMIRLVNVTEEMRLLSDLRAEQSITEANEQLREINPTAEPIKMPRRLSQAEGVVIRFRRSSLGLVPFVELPLVDRAGVFNGRLPLWEVIQGPSLSPEVSLNSMHMYLDSNGYGFHTTLRPSEIPLRT